MISQSKIKELDELAKKLDFEMNWMDEIRLGWLPFVAALLERIEKLENVKNDNT